MPAEGALNLAADRPAQLLDLCATSAQDWCESRRWQQARYKHLFGSFVLRLHERDYMSTGFETAAGGRQDQPLLRPTDVD
ncbi:MAG: hypothetical protein KBH81_06895, partial [Phycisphaerae bacterium]|nr:hypothetical protein [Phycisphaerae bacterium]